jgi:alkylation response protein AidB-like acyl-CoA dehydrogenase
MRATGSNDVVLDKVFVPESAVTLRRPKGRWHPFYNAVVTIATPITSAVYVGVIEAAREMAIKMAQRKRDDVAIQYLAGEMDTALVAAQIALESMVAAVAEYEFPVVDQVASETAIKKTLIVRAVGEMMERAMELIGGAAFFRGVGFERLYRDAQAMRFHAMPEKRQLRHTGRLALGLDP